VDSCDISAKSALTNFLLPNAELLENLELLPFV